jgi:hypothetical protein
MTQFNKNEFAESMRRILLFFVSFFQWIIGFQKVASQESVKKQSPKDKYIELQKNKFLLSFQEETHDWNSNIDAIIKDQTQLTELLKDSKNDLEKKWRSRILIENTPRGNVIMFYDIYKRGFSYYCDQAVMPYDIMNAVAMKYVLTFHCRDLFVDSNVIPSSKPLDEKRNEEEDKTILNQNTVKNNNQAFAKFKTYNNATKKVGISPENDKTINCFLHLGASRNWSPILKKVKPNPLNGFQTDLIPNSSNNKISYLDYKNKMKKDQ